MIEIDLQFETIVCGFVNKISDFEINFILLSENTLYEVFEDQYIWKVK